jgi:hypothetical protein
MKLLGKYFAYAVIMVLLITGSVLLIKNHPEVQFAFLIPGVFIVTYTVMRDSLFARHTTIRSFRGR